MARLFDWQRAAWNHGQASMLWVVTPTQVRVLDAYARPPAKPGRDGLERIEIRRFERIADQLEELRDTVSRQEIESGLFWRRAGRGIDRKNRVDRQLIQDLSGVAGRLCEAGLELSEAHRLLLRAIFASYLESRGWLTPQRLRPAVGVEGVQEALKKPQAAQRLFAWLAETFNGDVFPAGRARPYSAGQLEELRFFLRGGDPKTGQRYLWPYEFDVVPVELLSSIYEEFAHALDPTAAKSRSTHYTPMNLVELTLAEVFDDDNFEDELPAEPRVLDLACGSGVFLVEALRRLVSRRLAAGAPLTRKLIRDTLYKQIFGVDLSAGAVQIAAVSLYLAALELDPNPHLGNGVKFEALVYPDDADKRSERRCFNLFAADAFDVEADFNRQAPFAEKSFAAVFGNPPWTRPRGARAAAGAAALDELRHVVYCREREISLPSQDPPDQAFAWRAADFAVEGARLGLILSARRFFSHHPDTVTARQGLLGRFVPRTVVNLAALHRERVFPTAIHPGMIYVAANQPGSPQSSFSYVTVERSKDFERHGTIEIGPELVKSLSSRRAIHEDDFLKIATWGNARDARLVEEL
ncbi:MAG TPA: N-6 DNA methylase, partial [Thermoanaerobaculia bacterium]